MTNYLRYRRELKNIQRLRETHEAIEQLSETVILICDTDPETQERLKYLSARGHDVIDSMIEDIPPIYRFICKF